MDALFSIEMEDWGKIASQSRQPIFHGVAVDVFRVFSAKVFQQIFFEGLGIKSGL